MDSSPEKNDSPLHRIQPDGNGETNGRPEERLEQHILKFSVAGALFFAVLGLVWGAFARSQMIRFDGLYSFISVILSSLSVYTARSITKGDDERFPFGRAQMEPLTVALKSLVITLLCALAFTNALISLFSGGSDINALSAVAYALVATTGCLFGFLYITRKRKKAGTSVLVKAESMQWLMDMSLSAAVLVGFLIASIMQHMGYEAYARYIDPLMLVIASAFFIKVPVGSLITGIKDMLKMAPGGNIYRVSKEALEKIAKKRGFDGFVLRVSKGGREFDYKIGFVSRDPRDERSLVELDSIRQEVQDSLQALFDNPIWLCVSFIHDKKWV